ncbi:MAG: biotin/lipoyl-containing protein, partial [Agrococcus casei]
PDEPYFLEMNTRLQVEHPVTEEVTGLDLVELMTTIAAGQPLPLEQTDVVLTGHSIEARIYAEDPNEGFLPTGGTIVRLRQPHYDDPRIRFDSGVEEGSVVSSNYDPMLAKVIATGETRDEALATLQEGLAHLFIAGVVTNVGFLTTLLARDEVVAGEIDTEFIDRNVESLTDSRVPTAAYAKAALAVSGPSSNRIGTAWQADGWRIGGPAEIRSRLADATVFIDPRTMQTRVVADDPATLMPDTDNEPSGFATFGWTSYEDRHPTGTHVDDDAVWVQLHGHTYRVERHRAAEAALAEGEAAITAPMPGAVVAIAVADGDTVEVGQHVLSVEAMKMEHKLMATQAGVVRLEVAEGEQVTRGQLLAHIEAAESANGGMQ